ncbi:hypothetical protein [Benzoatithermus flavus]|uniref:Uncharacterized protein n=1 Tax=Benzoatithermus flavus TaxID=3108223 RepID=A0ABU8XNN8_9PROT
MREARRPNPRAGEGAGPVHQESPRQRIRATIETLMTMAALLAGAALVSGWMMVRLQVAADGPAEAVEPALPAAGLI